MAGRAGVSGWHSRCQSTSSAIPMPSAFRSSMMARASSTSVSMAPSVISICMRSSGNPVCVTASAISATTALSRNCTGDTLNASTKPWPHPTACAHAVRTIWEVRRSISPHDSAIDIKVTGATGPVAGSVQRASTSKPTMAPVSKQINGWNAGRSKPPSSAAASLAQVSSVSPTFILSDTAGNPDLVLSNGAPMDRARPTPVPGSVPSGLFPERALVRRSDLFATPPIGYRPA